MYYLTRTDILKPVTSPWCRYNIIKSQMRQVVVKDVGLYYRLFHQPNTRALLTGAFMRETLKPCRFNGMFATVYCKVLWLQIAVLTLHTSHSKVKNVNRCNCFWKDKCSLSRLFSADLIHLSERETGQGRSSQCPAVTHLSCEKKRLRL